MFTLNGPGPRFAALPPANDATVPIGRLAFGSAP
jgi:hypothetical protein